MRIIAAIDILNGKCVRLTQGKYEQSKSYFDNPVDVALMFQDAGLQYLHLVDLDGARSGKFQNWKIIEQICAKTTLTVDVGGGIKTSNDISALISLGVHQVNIGSAAVNDADRFREWLSVFGNQKIILSADVRKEVVAINGWQKDAALNITDLIGNFQPDGLAYVVCTDIDADGTLQGPNVGLYQKLTSAFPSLKVIASGGVGSLNDIKALSHTGVNGVIVGKAIYENKILPASLMDLQKW